MVENKYHEAANRPDVSTYAYLRTNADRNAWDDVYNDLKYGQTIGTTEPAVEGKFVKDRLLPHLELNEAIDFAANGGRIDSKLHAFGANVSNLVAEARLLGVQGDHPTTQAVEKKAAELLDIKPDQLSHLSQAEKEKFWQSAGRQARGEEQALVLGLSKNASKAQVDKFEKRRQLSSHELMLGLPANISKAELKAVGIYESHLRGVVATTDARSMSAVYDVPPLQGTYKAPDITQHPFVFGSKAQMEALLADRSTHTNIQLALQNLEQNVNQEIGNGSAYTTPYNGNDITQYITKFSYGDDEANNATSVASDCAMYSYLHSLDPTYGNDATAKQAQDLSKNILLNWANGGFPRDKNGKVTENIFQFNGEPDGLAPPDVALQIGRGMPAWTNAQDLLMAQGAFSSGEQQQLNGFLGGLYNLMKVGNNYTTENDWGSTYRTRFSNRQSNALLGMLSIAALQGNRSEIEDLAYGAKGDILDPFTRQVDGNIYGINDHVGNNSGTTGPSNDGAKGPDNSQPTGSPSEYQISTAAPGEVTDRERMGLGKVFGYPLWSLQQLSLCASILDQYGFNASGYKGNHGQSIQLGMEYYSHYFSKYLSTHTNQLPPTSDGTPSYEQYVGGLTSYSGGATIDGTDHSLEPFVIGRTMYLNDPKIDAVLASDANLDVSQDGGLDSQFGPGSQQTKIWGVLSYLLPYLPNTDTAT